MDYRANKITLCEKMAKDGFLSVKSFSYVMGRSESWVRYILSQPGFGDIIRIGGGKKREILIPLSTAINYIKKNICVE